MFGVEDDKDGGEEYGVRSYERAAKGVNALDEGIRPVLK